MARVEIRVSDLSREPIQEDGQAARLIVEHPEYPEPIGLDVLPSEVQEYLTDERKRFVVVSLEEAGNLTPQERYVRQLYLRLKLIGQRSSQNGDSPKNWRDRLG
jgi:hypothetical protein